MKFRLVGQIYVYSIENWILVSYQAPKQRPRSCQKDMAQCPKNMVVKLKVTAGYCRMAFQFFHGRGIPVWSPIPEQQHRAVGRRAVLRSSSCLRPGPAAWHGFGRDQPTRNILKHGFLTLVSLSLPPSPSVFHPCITRRFRKHVQTCWGLHFHPLFPSPWAKHATRPPRPWRVEPVNCLKRSWLFKDWQLGSHKQYPWLTGA